LPELPEVEAVCRRLRESLADRRRIVEARILRPGIVRPQDPAMVESAVAGREIQAIRRIGKHILMDLDADGPTVHIHLRMTGNLYLVPDVRLHVASTRAWFRFADGSGIVFDDPRALGRISVRKPREVPPDVGPEPNQISADGFISLARGFSRSPMKLLLMDQSKIAGLGNIYAAEALFQARIHPAKPAGKVSARKLAELHAILIETLGLSRLQRARLLRGRRILSGSGLRPRGRAMPTVRHAQDSPDRAGRPVHVLLSKMSKVMLCLS
jgi:formamidopyrimidine-DNA glycosylase